MVFRITSLSLGIIVFVCESCYSFNDNYKDINEANSPVISLISIDDNLCGKWLQMMQDSIQSYYDVSINITKAVPINDSLFFAKELVQKLPRIIDNKEETIIAVTKEKLMLKLTENIKSLIRGYTDTRLNVIIISTYLIEKETNSIKAFNFNLAKVAKHELGHLYGLKHCEFSDECFMVSSFPTPNKFYNSGHDLCSKCRELIRVDLSK